VLAWTSSSLTCPSNDLETALPLLPARRARLKVRATRITLWPLDDGVSYGLDAVYHGHVAKTDAEQAARAIRARDVKARVVSTADGAWAVRLGPIGHDHALEAVRRFMAGTPRDSS
jgi:hypothetical protein